MIRIPEFSVGLCHIAVGLLKLRILWPEQLTADIQTLQPMGKLLADIAQHGIGCGEVVVGLGDDGVQGREADLPDSQGILEMG